MKAVKFALILLSLIGLIFVGCSDESQSPVSPNDQSSASLQKSTIRYFTGSEGPTGLLDASQRTADGKLFFYCKENTFFKATFSDGGDDPLSGTGVLEMHGKLDLTSGEGFTWGKLTITPTNDVQGGVWKISWHGKMVLDPTTGVITAPLKWVGHGNGGIINGMQIFSDDIISFVDPMNWSGGGGTNCYIKVHK